MVEAAADTKMILEEMIAEVLDHGKRTSLAERIMEMTGIPVAIRIGMITKGMKEEEQDQTTDRAPKEIRAGRIMAVIGIPEAVAAERLVEAPGVTAATRNILLRMNGIGKGIKAGTGRTTRWKKMMTIVRREVQEQEDECSVNQPEKMMKACANYLRINSRIYTGLKKL